MGMDPRVFGQFPTLLLFSVHKHVIHMTLETRKPPSLKTFFSDSALICAVSALEYYVRHVSNVFGITAALFVVLLEGFSIPPH